MKNVEKIQNSITHLLTQKSKIDGRFFLLIILIIYFVPVIIAYLSPNYPQSWKSQLVYPLVPKMLPSFADMRVITAGSECIRLGYDVLIDNPCDPWNRPMNYPPIWSILASWGLDQSHTKMIGIVCALLFFTSIFLIIKRLNYFEALLYGSIICSPSIMLAVERGNNDLIVFVILSLSLLIMEVEYFNLSFLSLGIILFASILKLYPIFTILSFLKEKKRVFIFFSLFVMTFFGVYIIANFERIKLVSAATPRAIRFSYGGKIIFDLFFRNLNKYPLFLLALLSIVLISFLLVKKRNSLNNLNIERIDSFRMGASIYMGTFFIGNNWDYRLIFLIFTIPQILLWIKYQNVISKISSLAFMGITATIWLSSKSTSIYHLDEFINWLLFLFFTYTVILTLPVWLKRIIYRDSNIN